MGGPPPASGAVLRGQGPVRVFRAEIGGVPVVVKRLAGEADAAALRRFERERRLAGLLAHPCLPHLVAEGEDWIAFRALGAALCEPDMAARHADPAALRPLLAALAGALAFAHARGVVHRDVKPAHVLFDGKTPVLIDFGIAGTPGDDLQRAELSGSPAWMAPEQLAGEEVGPAADIWPLAALGLYLLTGQKPYEGEAEAVLRRRQAGEPPGFTIPASLERVDPVLAGLLRAGLAAPADRPAAADFARLLGGASPSP